MLKRIKPFTPPACSAGTPVLSLQVRSVRRILRRTPRTRWHGNSLLCCHSLRTL